VPHRLEDRAVFKDHGRYIHVTTYAPDEGDEGELIAIECVVGSSCSQLCELGLVEPSPSCYADVVFFNGGETASLLPRVPSVARVPE
jgi:hypothetical protein